MGLVAQSAQGIMTFYDLTLHKDDWIRFAIVAGGSIIVYIFLWKKNRPLAIIILLGLIGYLSYHTFNWQEIKTHFFVDWGSGGLTK